MIQHKDPYTVVRRVDWIKNHLIKGQPFNSSDIVAEFNISRRTVYRDIHFVRDEYFKDRLAYDMEEQTYYLE